MSKLIPGHALYYRPYRWLIEGVGFNHYRHELHYNSASRSLQGVLSEVDDQFLSISCICYQGVMDRYEKALNEGYTMRRVSVVGDEIVDDKDGDHYMCDLDDNQEAA